MDLMMPRLDGWEAIRRLKRDWRTRRIPIIACTGHVIGSSAERALDAGCDGYITKPCLPADLLAEIRRVLPPAGA
jgi:CheY-like chemotaxis protein